MGRDHGGHGDKINVLGPRGKIMYKGMGELTLFRMSAWNKSFELWILGEFNFHEEKESGDFNQIVKAKNVVMIAGGTGIAPMLQFLRLLKVNKYKMMKFWT